MNAQNLIEILEAAAHNTNTPLEELPVFLDIEGWSCEIDGYHYDVNVFDNGFVVLLAEQVQGYFMTQEKNYRPTTLADYCGQPQIKEMLEIYIAAAKMRNEALDHVIVYGPSGMGKSTISHIIANEMGAKCITQAAPALKTKDDLVDLLTGLSKGDVLFLDEIHSLNKKMQEVLFVAMEEYYVNVVTEDGIFRQDIPHFTLIGATTDFGKLSEPVRNRFQISLELLPYENDHIARIVANSFAAIGVNITFEDALSIARRTRGIPRVANSYVRRVYDVALVLNNGEINEEVVNKTFKMAGIDKNGLTRQDINYLTLLDSSGRTLGVDSVASYLNVDKATLENVIEPYLMAQGYIVKTPRGRSITVAGKEVVKEHNNG